MGQLIGFARVSTQGQDIDGQLETLKAAGCTKIFYGKNSGAKEANKARLDEIINYIREGDVVLVTKLDRLGRSLRMILEALDAIEDKKAAVRSLDGAIDTSNQSPTAKAQQALIGVFAQLERDLIVSRTSEGRDLAMRNGIQFGRKQKLNNNEKKIIKERHARGESVRKLASEHDVSRPTIDRIIKDTNKY
ncbi:recombinase family protein [Marinomonas primoryensis]|uniref:Recombinase family protein n=1 Tax=Marinomonas primoryensis TaxID=178399 RepID=A0ABV0KXV9_9GAMM